MNLTESERRDLGCACARLDDTWHHVRYCRVPVVEAIVVARLAAVRDLLDDWERQAGEQSEAWRVFGPQVISVPFAVSEVRAALDGQAPAPEEGQA